MPLVSQAYRYAFLLGLALTIAACSAIPFSSLSKLRQLEPENFIQLEPEEMLARIEIPPDYQLDLTDFTLGISLNHAEPRILSMVPASRDLLDSIQRPANWDNANQEFIFQLDESGIQNMRELQQVMLKEKINDTRLDINFLALSWPEDSDGLLFSIDLHLSRSQGFFRFLDEAKIPVEFLQEILDMAKAEKAVTAAPQ